MSIGASSEENHTLFTAVKLWIKSCCVVTLASTKSRRTGGGDDYGCVGVVLRQMP